jgi:hypothetical protein
MLNREGPPPLAVDLDTVGYIIVKAREVDAKVASAPRNPGSDFVCDREEEIQADDPGREELQAAIDDLDEDAVIDLIALAWVGRGDYGAEDWREARLWACERHRRHFPGDLVSTPMLGDYLEDGLLMLGYLGAAPDSGPH